MINYSEFWRTIKDIIVNNTSIQKVVDTYPSKIPKRPYVILYPIDETIDSGMIDNTIDSSLILITIEIYADDSLTVDNQAKDIRDAILTNLSSQYTLKSYQTVDSGKVADVSAGVLHYKTISLVLLE